MGNGFYENTHATEVAAESASEDAGRAKVELEDILEQMELQTSILQQLLIHAREMTGDNFEDCAP